MRYQTIMKGGKEIVTWSTTNFLKLDNLKLLKKKLKKKE
jgi:hypothetical protein